MEQKIIVFLDNIQRTIVATEVLLNDKVLVVTKAAVLNVAPTNEKKLQVQLYPLMFREFSKNRDKFPEWEYARSQIVLGKNVDLEPNLIKQYDEMFRSTAGEGAPTIKLFDADQK